MRFANEREATANELNKKGAVEIHEITSNANKKQIKGSVTSNNSTASVALLIDEDEKLTEASCTCRFYQKNKLYKGPCEHILAIRMAGNHLKV